MYLLWYTIGVTDDQKLSVRFYKSPAGNEPVREWLSDPKQVLPQDKKIIGIDIKTIQYGWPMGMPMVRKLEPGLWESRSNISIGVARVLFTIQGNIMVLLHGFIKKSKKTPLEDLELARKRMIRWEEKYEKQIDRK